MLLHQNQLETPGSLGRTRGSSRTTATVDGCNGGSRRRVWDPSLVETGVREVDGWMDDDCNNYYYNLSNFLIATINLLIPCGLENLEQTHCNYTCRKRRLK